MPFTDTADRPSGHTQAHSPEAVALLTYTALLGAPVHGLHTPAARGGAAAQCVDMPPQARQPPRPRYCRFRAGKRMQPPGRKPAPRIRGPSRRGQVNTPLSANGAGDPPAARTGPWHVGAAP